MRPIIGPLDALLAQVRRKPGSNLHTVSNFQASVSAAARPRVAVLIDAENTPAAKIGAVMAEAAGHGTVTVRRAFADWRNPTNSGWNTALELHGIRAHMPVGPATRNGTDMALIIDAMDLLHSRSIDCVCLVTSDADFCSLASRLREGDIATIIIGRRGTSPNLIAAANTFVYLEELPDLGVGGLPVPKQTRQQLNANPQLIQALNEVVGFLGDEHGWAAVAAVGSVMVSQHHDFSARTYGYRTITELLEVTGHFELLRDPEHGVMVRASATYRRARVQRARRAATRFLTDAVTAATDDDGWASLEQLQHVLTTTYPAYAANAYGFRDLGTLLKTSGLFDVETLRPASKHATLRARVRKAPAPR